MCQYRQNMRVIVKNIYDKKQNSEGFTVIIIYAQGAVNMPEVE